MLPSNSDQSVSAETCGFVNVQFGDVRQLSGVRDIWVSSQMNVSAIF